MTQKGSMEDSKVDPPLPYEYEPPPPYWPSQQKQQQEATVKINNPQHLIWLDEDDFLSSYDLSSGKVF